MIFFLILKMSLLCSVEVEASLVWSLTCLLHIIMLEFVFSLI